MKKYLLITFVLFSVLLPLRYSFAAIIFDNRSVGTSTLISDGGGVGYMNLFLGQASSSIATTTLYYSYWAGYSSLISFVRCDTQVTGLLHTDLADGSTPWGYDNFTVGNRFLTTDGLAVNVTGTITASIIAGKYYFLQPPSVISSNDYGCVAYGDGDGSTFNANNVYTGGTFNSCLADDAGSCFGNITNATIAFLFPENGTTTLPFTNFILHVGGISSIPLSPTDPIYLTIRYGASATSTPYALNWATDVNNINSLPSPYVQQLLPFGNATSRNYFAYGDISSAIDIAGRPTGTIFASATTSFTMVNSSTFIQSGGGLQFLTPLIASSTQGTCQSGNFIADGFCIFLVGALTPQQGATTYMQSAIAAFQAAPPFGQVFGVLNSVNNAVSSSPVGTDLDVQFSFGSASGSIPFLTSSTMSGGVTSAGKTMLFSVEDAMFGILDLGLIFFVPWHWWRKKHQPQLTQK